MRTTTREAGEQLHVDEQAEKGGSRVGGGGMLRLGPSSSSSASRVVDQLLEAWRTLAELQSRIPTEDAHFANPGDGAHVPIFLKLTPYPNMPRLRNKKMPKAEVETLVREYWIFFYEMRRKAVQSKPPPPGASSLSQRMARGRAGSIAAAAGMSSADLHAQIARKPATVATTAAVTPTRPASGSGGGDGEQQQQQQQQQPAAALAPPSEAASVFNAFLEARVFAAHQAASAASAPAASGSDATPNEEQQRRFAAVELALNALDSCRRHAYDADLELFLDVISGRVPMEAHAQQLLLVEQLRNAFAVADRQEHEGRSRRRAALGGLWRGALRVPAPLGDADLPAPCGARARHAAGHREWPRAAHQVCRALQGGQRLQPVRLCRAGAGQALRAPREYVGQIEAALRERTSTAAGTSRCDRPARPSGRLTPPYRRQTSMRSSESVWELEEVPRAWPRQPALTQAPPPRPPLRRLPHAHHTRIPRHRRRQARCACLLPPIALRAADALRTAAKGTSRRGRRQ